MVAGFACESSIKLLQRCQFVQFLEWEALENNFPICVSIFIPLTRDFQVEKRSNLSDPRSYPVIFVAKEVT